LNSKIIYFIIFLSSLVVTAKPYYFKEFTYNFEEKQRQDQSSNDSLANLKSFYKNRNAKNKLLEIQDQELKTKQLELSVQAKYLENQNRIISTQNEALKSQNEKLKKQYKFNLLLIVTGIISIGFMVYIIIVNKNRRDLLKRLKEKHKEVAKKSQTLQMQNKELEQFAYIASHDLQEPLHTITSFADFMQEDYADKLDEEGSDNLTYIKEGCNRMKNLIESLLDYSRIGSQRKLKFIDSKKIIDTVIHDFKALIEESKAEITYEKMPLILGYSTELRMLFQNLISNAIKFKTPNTIPRVHIIGEELNRTEEYSHRWQFQIKDNGIGIANEDQKKIFDIFQRLHTREEYSGTGIGLAHCKKVIMFHNGEIWVNSSLGKGTIFNFTVQFNPEEYNEVKTSCEVAFD